MMATTAAALVAGGAEAATTFPFNIYTDEAAWLDDTLAEPAQPTFAPEPEVLVEFDPFGTFSALALAFTLAGPASSPTAPITLGISLNGSPGSDFTTFTLDPDATFVGFAASERNPVPTFDLFYVVVQTPGATMTVQALTVGESMSPVPLPAAGWMLAAGLAGLGLAFGRLR